MKLTAAAAVLALGLVSQGTIAAPVYTFVNNKGNTNGSERCLVGGGLVGGGCASGGSGNAFGGAASLTQIYAGRVDGGDLVRIDDESDKLWLATNGQSFEVRAFGGYLSNSGPARGGIAGTNAASFVPFPAGAELSPDNRYLGPEAVIPEPDDFVGNFLLQPWETVAAGPSPFALVLHAISLGRYYTSNNGDPSNVGFSDSGNDRMVTFRATVDGETRYLVGFERLNVDKDFQDKVYELRGIAPVPEPGTSALLLAGAAALLLIGRRRMAALH